MVLIFDTETTGLPKNWKAPMTQVDNWPRVIQLALILSDLHGKEISRGKHLIKPDQWKIPKEKFWIENGFDNDISLANGIPITEVLNYFFTDLQKCNYMVSHNMAFDYNVLGAEMIRANLKGKKVDRICTMEIGTAYCKLPGRYGSYKWPKLIELHYKLFNKGFDGAHDALADVIACKDCFYELMKMGIIKLKAQEAITDD